MMSTAKAELKAPTGAAARRAEKGALDRDRRVDPQGHMARDCRVKTFRNSTLANARANVIKANCISYVGFKGGFLFPAIGKIVPSTLRSGKYLPGSFNQ